MRLVPLISIILLSACSNVAVIESDTTVKTTVQEDVKAVGLEEHTIIDPHLQAYNNNDFKNFKAVFHKDIEAYEFPNKLLFKGMDNFDKTYEKLVTYISKTAFISKRIVEGSFVVDMETVKVKIPEKGDHVIEGLVIYQIKDNLIYRIMFLKDK